MFVLQEVVLCEVDIQPVWKNIENIENIENIDKKNTGKRIEIRNKKKLDSFITRDQNTGNRPVIARQSSADS